LATGHGAVTVPVEIADMPDRVVWLPTNSAGSRIRSALRAGHGTVVSISSGVPVRSTE
jgi:NADH-quinone oxidoreductase subunit G